MTCSQLLNHLLNGSLIKMREVKPPPMPLPLDYNINARCEFHTREPGHSVDNYKAFMFKVQDLLDFKAISLAPAGPTFNNNPMLPYVDHPVNRIQESAEFNLISKVDMLKTPLFV